MDSRLIFIIWLAILFLGQVSSRRKRQQKLGKKQLPYRLHLPKLKLPKKPQPIKQPEPFTCEQAEEPAPTGPMRPKVRQDLHSQVQPVRSSLRDEITDLKPDVVPQVQEDREPVPAKLQRPVLSGSLREGMLWSMVLGQPRSKVSWAEEQRRRHLPG